MKYVCFLFFAVITSIGCSDKEEVSSNKIYKRLVTTTPMLFDAVTVIVENDWVVDGLMGEGVDPHLYKPTALDVKKLNSADLIVANGLHLEGRMLNSIKQLESKGTHTLLVGENLSEDKLLYVKNKEIDPHVWMDVSTWSHIFSELSYVLCQIDPINCQKFQDRSDNFISELLSLDSLIKNAVKTIPEKNRFLITAHDAFQYYGNAYGLRVIGLQGVSTEYEVGLKDVSNLVDLIVENSIPSIFVESSVPTRQIESVIEGCISKGFSVSLGGELYSDSMGSPGTIEGTYIGMMIHNTRAIVSSLGGNVAPLDQFQFEIK